MKGIISQVNPYSKNGKQLVCLTVNGKTVHVSQAQLTQRGFPNPFDAVGGTAEVEFYKEGDMLLNDAECTQSDVIVKNFSIIPSLNVSIARQTAQLLAQQFGFTNTPTVAVSTHSEETVPA